MTDIHVARMKTRFRLPVSAWSERARLARIFSDATDGLETALHDAGVNPRDEICVRRVSTFIRLRLTGSDRAVAQYWSGSLARAIRDAVRGSSPDVVLYRSRSDALADLVRSVLRNDLSRAWAWEKLGLWVDERDGGATVRGAITALRAHARFAPAILADVGTHASLDPLVDAGEQHWIALAAAVVEELAGFDLLARVEQVNERQLLTLLRDGQLLRIGERILSASRIGAAFRGHAAHASETTLLRSIAALAVAEVEPWCYQDPPRAVRLIATMTQIVSRPPKGKPRGAEPDRRHAEHKKDVAETRPRGTAKADEKTLPITDYGGLLFLLHVVGECDLPRVMTADDRFGERSLRWMLHQLAIVLTGCASRDPAALAFAGLPPSSAPPDEDGHPITEREAATLSRYAQSIVETVRERFSDDEVHETLSLTAWICERRAEIFADPGWIEVRFRHDSVDTAIRRSGLDLNPDFLPWLGAVVRFAYV